jgi:Ca-activated chloride channel family protein
MDKKLMAALLAVGLGAAACTGDIEPDGPGDTDPAETAEARDYYDDYREDQGDGASGGTRQYISAEDGAADAGAPAPEPMPVPPVEPGVLDDNVFVDSGDSVWTTTSSDRESTFALDVDTGSFSVARTFLEEGYQPEPDSIRVEEWVNSFEYGDQPPGEGALGLTVESGAAPRGQDGTTLVRVGVSTVELTEAERAPANITFVIDTSGSMDVRERLGLVQASLALLVDNLREDDTISIVTYGSDAAPLLEPTPVGDRETIIEAIDALQPGGSTNMEAGLDLGYRQARESLDQDGINVVVLASDGVANIGVTDPQVLTDQITRAGQEGIHLVTVGYGMGNYNDVLMEQLSNQGDGFYSYVDTFEEAERLFVEDLTPTLTVVAGDSKAQLVFDETQVSQYRLIGYQNRELDDSDFTDDTVDAGELGAGHQVSALYEVRPADGADETGALGTVSLRWEDAGSGEVEQADADISWPQDGQEPSDSLRMAALVADTGELLKGNEVVTQRGVTLADLAVEAQDLTDREVPGAAEIGTFIEQAQDASPPQPTWQD